MGTTIQHPKARPILFLLFTVGVVILLLGFQNCRSTESPLAPTATNASCQINSADSACFSSTSPAVCHFNGETIPAGAQVTAYLTPNAIDPSTCQMEVRTCTKGALTGTYLYPACAATTANAGVIPSASPGRTPGASQGATCTLGGQTLASGETTTRYFSTNSFSCTPESRTCTDGFLSGTATATSCTPQTKTGPQIGMLYSLWHCPWSGSVTANPSRVIYDISQILSGVGNWGPIAAPHWWSKPDNGYYCLSENDAILRQHGQMLADAGIDFIFLDVTNWETIASAGGQVIQPLNALVRVWSQIPGAPKVVPWFPMKAGADLVSYFDNLLTQNPQIRFVYQGKPLMLAVANNSTDDVIAGLQSRYTVRKMWGVLSAAQLNAGQWSFLQNCQGDFKANSGLTPCNQMAGVANPEQISVTTAYQAPAMSDTGTAIPKFYGLTFIRQLQTARRYPSAFIVTITGWNEWIAGRFCNDFSLSCNAAGEVLPNGNRVFIDQYNAEYSRDMEPGGGVGAFYFNLLKASLQLFRSGQDPIAALSVNSMLSPWSSPVASTGPSATRPIFRSYNPVNFDSLISTGQGEATAAGYIDEGSRFSLYTTGTSSRITLYRCNRSGWHFMSQDLGCEGAAMEYIIGYAGAVPTPEAPYPLFRCDIDGSQRKMETKNQGECLNGFHTIAILGYVP